MAGKGAPKGNKYAETHGIVTLPNLIKRRTRKGRSFIDRRSHTGQNALAVEAELLEDLGGADRASKAQKVIVELVGRDLYLLDEGDRRIQHVCKKIPQAKNNPEALARSTATRQPIIANLTRSLTALGLQRASSAGTLDEIFGEQSEGEPADADTETESDAEE
jgi:hypothetical protein